MVGIMLSSKIGEKGQVVIPMPIRKQFNIKTGTDVIFEVQKEQIIIKTNSLKPLEDFLSLPKQKFPKNIDWDKEYYARYDLP